MTPRQATLLRLLQRYPDGLGLADVMLALDGTHYDCSSDLRALREAGEAESCKGIGGAILWAAAAGIAAVEARVKESRRAAILASRQRTSMRHLTAEQRAEEEACTDEFARRPMRRALVEQSRWAGQVAVPGPTSVFDLARTAA